MLPLRVLVVDDELFQRKIISEQLSELGFAAETAENARAAMQVLQSKDFDVVLLDVQMPETNGFDALALIKKLEDAPEVIMLTLDNSLESGILAMRSGAYDYLTKPASSPALEMAIGKAAEKRRLVRRNFSLRDFVKGKNDRADWGVLPVQASAVMRRITEQAEAVARLNLTVLITGESGTGKDVLARFIHNRSQRAASVMVSINCGAMPESLFESEFFGYEKGAFTGADATKRGLVEAADGATLFLDEIGELPPVLQVKLLRFLESGQFRRVGSLRDLYADTRVIAATNQDLTSAVRENRFRADLFYRLNVIELHVPPLRERVEDLSALIDDFLDLFRAQFAKPDLHLTEAARRKLLEYQYPGNIRELKNIVERAAALASGETIEVAQIFFRDAAPSSESAPENVVNENFSPINTANFDFLEGEKILQLDELERRYILSILGFSKGNRERAAALLGISERTLYRRLRDYE